jgi:hypothetical protein
MKLLFISVQAYLPNDKKERKKEGRDIINLSEKERNLHYQTKFYTLQRALNKECFRLSNFIPRLLSLLIGFMSRSPSVSNCSEDCSLFKCPPHCLWYEESTLLKF